MGALAKPLLTAHRRLGHDVLYRCTVAAAGNTKLFWVGFARPSAALTPLIVVLHFS